jgi:hypothetical protein
LPFTLEWTLARALGLFLFSSYVKSLGEYVEINFLEEVARWKMTSGRLRADITGRIVEGFLTGVPLSSMAEEGGDSNNVGNGDANNNTANSNGGGDGKKTPPKSEINEYDLAMVVPIGKLTTEDISRLKAESYDATTDKSAVGLCGPVLEKINKKVDQLRDTPGFGSSRGIMRDSLSSTMRSSVGSSTKSDIIEKSESSEGGGEGGALSTAAASRRHLSMMTNTLPEELFDEAIVIIVDIIKEKHWKGFLESEQYTKLLNFLWFRDRTVVEEDFFLMRVLGRGGFGLVTGECVDHVVLCIVPSYLCSIQNIMRFQPAKRALRANSTP